MARRDDSTLSAGAIAREITRLQGEIDHNAGLAFNAPTERDAARFMRKIEARQAIIRRLQALPKYEPFLPLDLPHAPYKRGRVPLKA